jgi:hypothetical protein
MSKLLLHTNSFYFESHHNIFSNSIKKKKNIFSNKTKTKNNLKCIDSQTETSEPSKATPNVHTDCQLRNT